jgi:signal transduction histidine kinase/HAMP domain-containing protein
MNDASDRSERAPASVAAPSAASGDAPLPMRGRLFRKYLVLILSLVGGALLVSGAISLYFTYQENKSALAALQQEKAIAAAARIDQYVRQIEQQLAYASLPQLDASDLELRRIEFLKLLRQAPEVTDIAQIDASGREQIYVSRLGMDVIGSGKDRSQEPAFRNAMRGKPWYGPVYFRKETEPYMTIALRSSDSGPVTVGDLNLKFIWDVVSRIKVGDKGKAYVVDANGYLVADPDIGLVLRKTNLASLPHVKAALGPAEPSEPATVSVDLAGTPVLTAVAPIAPLGWEVFVEQPVSEVYAKLNASILRTGALLLAGLVIAALCALMLARGMARPIRTLEEGAARIGAGELEQAIDVRTGDELESLAHSFNQMSSRLRESYASLERKVQERTAALTNALEQQTAIGEILRAISNSPTDVSPVLDKVAESAAHLCKAPFARVMLGDGGQLNPVAEYWEGRPVSMRTDPVALDRTSFSGRSMVERTTIHIDDVLPLLDVEYPSARANMLRFGCRAVLAVPLMREDTAYGAIFLARHEPGLFAPGQVALVETFARQAAIAIDNVRLFNETRDSLERQTATGEILKVIASSPSDVQPVFEAIVQSAARLFGRKAALRVVEAGGLRRMAQSYEEGDAFHGSEVLPIDHDSLVGRAVLDCQATQCVDTLAPDAPAYARANAASLAFRSIASAPLIRDGVAIGVISVSSENPGALSDKQMELLATFADQAVIAIQNVRLFNETKEALEQQTATADVLQVIGSSVADTAPVFEKILDSCQRLFATEEIGIFLVGDDGKVHAPAWRGRAVEHVVAAFPRPLDETVTGTVVRERRSIQISDAAAMPDAPVAVQSIVERMGNFSAAWAPMLWEGQGVGSICVLRQPPSQLSVKQLALLETFARQAAIAIQNSRLFNETREALEQQRASGEVLAAISSSIADTTPVFERIMTSCERLFSGRVIAIERVDDSGTICIESFRGPEPVHDQRIVGPLAPDASISANAILSKAVQHFPDLVADAAVPGKSRAAYAEVGVRAAIVAPMLWEGHGIGAISVGRDYAGPFSDKEIALLKTFADQAVIAIQNARLFREIQDKSRQLEIANKHKSEFLANMSHELRTPLNAIIGFSEVLLEKLFGDVNEKQEDYLKDIHSSGRHLLGLINDILDLSKIEAGRMELERAAFDLPTTLSNALTLVRERAQRHGIALGLDVDPSLSEITADERKLKQIVINLLTNAVKFTPDGGKVDLIARGEPSRVLISVRDTGIGIAPQDQAAVFEEFRQVGSDYTRKQEGTGLGLALTRRFVELHGGRIWLESEPGKGSTFTFEIPIASASAVMEGQAP